MYQQELINTSFPFKNRKQKSLWIPYYSSKIDNVIFTETSIWNNLHQYSTTHHHESTFLKLPFGWQNDNNQTMEADIWSVAPRKWYNYYNIREMSNKELSYQFHAATIAGKP